MRRTKRSRENGLLSLKGAVLVFIAVLCVISVATAEQRAEAGTVVTGLSARHDTPLRCEDEGRPAPIATPMPQIRPRP